MNSHSSPLPGVFPVLALLLGATSWGLMWYPFRLLEAGGVPSPVATLLTYVVAVCTGGIVFFRAWRDFPRNVAWLSAIALTAGITNVAYLVAIMQAEVVRIVLLFYLAPLWTVPLAWLLLREKLTFSGGVVMLMAISGAAVMLWRPEIGLPAPRNGYEWLGLMSGFTFAMCNVMVKAATRASPEAKSLAGCVGVVVVALPVALWLGPAVSTWPAIAGPHVLMLLAVGVMLIATSIAFQYGVTHLQANRAAVIMLFELVVAAVAAHYLAGEETHLREWVGGALIVGAGVVATVMEARGKASRV
ncbi:MAG: DMT family transporter [Betaproteobacteria bacterium]